MTATVQAVRKRNFVKRKEREKEREREGNKYAFKQHPPQSNTITQTETNQGTRSSVPLWTARPQTLSELLNFDN